LLVADQARSEEQADAKLTEVPGNDQQQMKAMKIDPG
jgi:hypothetical protein